MKIRIDLSNFSDAPAKVELAESSFNLSPNVQVHREISGGQIVMTVPGATIGAPSVTVTNIDKGDVTVTDNAHQRTFPLHSGEQVTVQGGDARRVDLACA